MSTFNGIITEIPGISVDNFQGDNLQSCVFFLSHFHSDHIRGISETPFLQVMSNSDIFLYASPITTRAIKARNPDKKYNLKELSIFEPDLVYIPSTGTYVTVTAIPAGHCMGSTMFLFETTDRTILYTGDFRVDAAQLRKTKPFNLNGGQLKTIDNMYLDTTFFYERYMHFPKRDEIVQRLVSEIQRGLKEKRLVMLSTPAYYCYEFVFQEISKALRQPLFVNENCAVVYKHVPEMDDVFTIDIEKSRIHVTCDKPRHFQNENMHWIKLCAMRFSNMKENAAVDEKSNDVYYAVYATHASYSEIQQFLEVFKPQQITPCVVRTDANDCEELARNISLFQQNPWTIPEPEEQASRIFKLNKTYNYKCDRNNSGNSSFVSSESPPSS